MALKAAGVGVEPTTPRPKPNTDVDPTEPTAAAPEPVEQGTTPKPTKAKDTKGPEDRHPITATVTIAKREALTAFAGSVTADETLNPEGVRVTLGTTASCFSELVADIAAGKPGAVDALKAIADAEDPKAAIARFVVDYKLAQKAA